MAGRRPKGTPADGKRSRSAELDYEFSEPLERDARPATPIAPPPRELVHGDELAIFGSQFGDLDLWHPVRFNRYRTLESGRVLMEVLDPIDARQAHSFHRYSYGDYTGLPADRGTVYYRLASEVTFYNRCPACRTECVTAEGACPKCAAAGWVPLAISPFVQRPERIPHYRRADFVTPAFSDGDDLVVSFQIVGMDGPCPRVRLGTLPRATIERIMAEPDPHRKFELDRKGNIVDDPRLIG